MLHWFVVERGGERNAHLCPPPIHLHHLQPLIEDPNPLGNADSDPAGKRVIANHTRPPGSPSNYFKIFPSQLISSAPTLRPPKSFGCNTYKNRGCMGEGQPNFEERIFAPASGLRYFITSRPSPFCHHTAARYPGHWPLCGRSPFQGPAADPRPSLPS